ncbi:hypothetical protein RRG08_025403 [Elysia crispata]|uniref:Uncharacterized protein n=1 Tax=Elysia crispata TaxID=231223 RepID=A0AAE1DBY6_9GAST|nr:hypothetical protein RRG08_025403 [Elysia crispata]
MEYHKHARPGSSPKDDIQKFTKLEVGSQSDHRPVILIVNRDTKRLNMEKDTQKLWQFTKALQEPDRPPHRIWTSRRKGCMEVETSSPTLTRMSMK